MEKKKVLRCGVYIRVSTVEQALEGWSLDAQKAALTREAKKRGFMVADYYVDEGKSARKKLKERKEIHRLLADVKAGDIDVIIFKDITRWFRSVADFYAVQKVLDEAGVHWIAAEQAQLNMETPDGRLQVNVLLSVGQNEADQTSERIKYVNEYLRQQKRWTGGNHTLPRGFKVDENQHVIIDQERAPFIRFLIDEVNRTSSVRASLITANAAFPDFAMYPQNGIALLRNPMLFGEYRGIPDFCEAYLTREQFDELQTKIVRTCRNTTKRVYVFSGLLICPCCGRKLAGNYTVKSAGEYKGYRCQGYRRLKDCENSHSTSELKLERKLFEYVKKAAQEKAVEVKSIKEAKANRPGPKDNSAQIDAALARLDDLYLNPTARRPMSREEYEKRAADIEAQRIVPDEVDDLPEVADLEAIANMMTGDLWETYQTFTPLERREFWRGILESVTVEGCEIKAVSFL